MTLGRRSHNGNISNFNRKCVSLAKHFELCRCFVWFDWTGWMLSASCSNALTSAGSPPANHLKAIESLAALVMSPLGVAPLLRLFSLGR